MPITAHANGEPLLKRNSSYSNLSQFAMILLVVWSANSDGYCVGTEPSALVYIGILVTSANTGPGGSVVSALASQAKGRWFNPQL